MSTVSAEVGHLIRTAREAANLTQLGLAQRLGVTQTAVSYWESGKRTPAIDDLLNLADTLGVPPARLLPAGGNIAGCPWCPDGHRDPNRRPWSVSMKRRDDGEPPAVLQVAPSAGGHVAESDAAWLRELIRRGRVELGVPPGGGEAVGTEATARRDDADDTTGGAR